jgi:hypothetical protein
LATGGTAGTIWTGRAKMMFRPFVALVFVTLCFSGINCQNPNQKDRSILSNIFESLINAKNRFLRDISTVFSVIRRRSYNRLKQRNGHVNTPRTENYQIVPSRHYVRIDEPVYLDVEPILHNAKFIPNTPYNYQQDRKSKSQNFKRLSYSTKPDHKDSYNTYSCRRNCKHHKKTKR